MSIGKTVCQLEMMAQEAANCYRVLCMLEGEQPLLDPFNQEFLEKQLERYGREWRERWQSS
tara:strand:+ start:54 stop:236 length:183 start_codon:yes stop_codon:yes gene_type:complete